VAKPNTSSSPSLFTTVPTVALRRKNTNKRIEKEIERRKKQEKAGTYKRDLDARSDQITEKHHSAEQSFVTTEHGFHGNKNLSCH
jgi:hypothetical protein